MEQGNLTEIICILDKSGSMGPLKEETILGLNKFIAEQHEQEGSCNLTLVQFNQQLNTTLYRTDIKHTPVLTVNSYQPEGYTALFDAIGLTLNTAIQTLSLFQNESLPSKVLVLIITDGAENASKIYSKQQVEFLITNQKNKGWEFEFFGANINSMAEASKLGIDAKNAYQWTSSKNGLDQMIEAMSNKTIEFRKK